MACKLSTSWRGTAFRCCCPAAQVQSPVLAWLRAIFQRASLKSADSLPLSGWLVRLRGCRCPASHHLEDSSDSFRPPAQRRSLDYGEIRQALSAGCWAMQVQVVALVLLVNKLLHTSTSLPVCWKYVHL